jgi:hypothetical protein
MIDKGSKSRRYCGRIFTTSEIQQIRELIGAEPKNNRAQLSRKVCDVLGWLRPDGRRKDMSCRVAMIRMERDGLLTLPQPLTSNGNGRNRPRITAASDPQEPIRLPAGRLGLLEFRIVDRQNSSQLWNELIERHHYLGYKPLPGAQLRYFVYSASRLLAAMGFGASAWKVAARDRFIGWSHQQRKQNLHLVVNNARFLILPWVTSRNLASRILSVAAKQLPLDWKSRYGYEPVLLETFVVQNLFRGTCYRAANWIHVGETQGRGKLDRQHRHCLPRKAVFLYPLSRRFRKTLCTQS